MALVKDRVDLHEIIDAACVAVRPLFESKQLSLTVDVVPELPAVTCDRTRIREVVLNLLSNAGRFTTAGGVNVRAWQESNHVVVRVADTGPGLSSDEQARLFQPFQQLASSARRHDGTGLGLSISKSFVELHDGKMWVESEQGSGTSFFFSLPLAPSPPRQSSAVGWLNPYQPYVERVRRPEAPPPELRPRLVLVESDSALQRLVQRYGGAIDVTPVHTLAEALAEAERTAAQAVLVNSSGGVELPDLVEEVRRSSVPTPVLACSIAATDPALLGVADVLVKPFTRDMLLAALARLERPVATVLLVEDEPDAQLLYRRMLASSPHGYRVLRANNGAQALEILQRRPVDAIILDLVMPEMDGYEFLAHKRQALAWAAIPVILTSARDPSDLPVTSRFLAVTAAHGLGARKLLDAVQALSTLLSPAGWPGGAAPQETPPG
jgi:DNA-binding response OmpR family regulator